MRFRIRQSSCGSPGFTRIVTGDRLPLRIDKGTVHLFDGASGKRLLGD